MEYYYLRRVQFQKYLASYLRASVFAGEGELRHLVASAMQEVKVYGGAKYVTPHSNLVHVRATQQFGTSRHPWYDCAIVRFDASDDPEEEKWQLGYVQIGIIFEAAGENYMLVRWMTSAQLGGAIENSQNEFESHHIRNLPRLKWNPRTRNCNRSFQIMPVSLLWKGAWVHEDFRDPEIFWHIKSTQFYMHQDPEQAMGIVAGGLR